VSFDRKWVRCSCSSDWWDACCIALSLKDGTCCDAVDLITHGAHQALASQAGISVHTRLNGNPDSFLSHKTYIDAATSGDPVRGLALSKQSVRAYPACFCSCRSGLPPH